MSTTQPSTPNNDPTGEGSYTTHLRELRDRATTIKEAMQEKFDKTSERRQSSDAGQALEEKITTMESTIDKLDSLIESIEDATNIESDLDELSEEWEAA